MFLIAAYNLISFGCELKVNGVGLKARNFMRLLKM